MTARRQLGFLWGTVALALVALSPWAERLAAGLPACPIKSIAGVPCFTCGATRSALALSSFDLTAALAVSPLATLAWIALIVGGLVAGLGALAGRPLPLLELRPTLGLRLLVGGALLGNWFYLLIAGV